MGCCCYCGHLLLCWQVCHLPERREKRWKTFYVCTWILMVGLSAVGMSVQGYKVCCSCCATVQGLQGHLVLLLLVCHIGLPTWQWGKQNRRVSDLVLGYSDLVWGHQGILGGAC
jgi:hypothetical protein